MPLLSTVNYGAIPRCHYIVLTHVINTSFPFCTRVGMLSNQKFPPISETTTCETGTFAQTLEKLFQRSRFSFTFDL